MSKHEGNQPLNSITCPRCGTINSADTMNCTKCRINLNFALENPHVAKGTALPDPEPQIVRIFNPSKFRYFTWMVGELTFATLIIRAISYISSGHISLGWQSGLLATAFLLMIQALATFRNYKVVVMRDSLSGPSAAASDTVTFKFEQIDMKKTRRRSALERLEGSRSVYSVNGKRIRLSGLVYNQDQIQAILNSIGYEEVE
jgi:hypothetical protein